jgi:Ran GTPase-activating protein (RanGAP) involved in mRNA processing and transport
LQTQWPNNGVNYEGQCRSVGGEGMKLVDIANDNELLEVGRLAVEKALVEWRDDRLSELGRRNGCVIRERDGSASSVIRFGPETAIKIGMPAIAKHLEEKAQP